MIKVVNNKVMLEDGAYAFGKKAVQVFIPALSTLYFTLATIWKLPDASEVVGSLAALAVFLGVALHLSSTQYDASGAAHDGTVSIAPNETGSVLSMHLDPADVAGKDSISLKVVPPVPTQQQLPTSPPPPPSGS